MRSALLHGVLRALAKADLQPAVHEAGALDRPAGQRPGQECFSLERPDLQSQLVAALVELDDVAGRKGDRQVQDVAAASWRTSSTRPRYRTSSGSSPAKAASATRRSMARPTTSVSIHGTRKSGRGLKAAPISSSQRAWMLRQPEK